MHGCPLRTAGCFAWLGAFIGDVNITDESPDAAHSGLAGEMECETRRLVLRRTQRLHTR